jgi:UDP-N-acetylmuramyl pentapeptide synthase
MRLCLADLAKIVHGHLHLGPMPPVAGEWTAIGRIALESRLVVPGDLFWRLPGHSWQSAGSTQQALLRGATGVVGSAADVAPWPGAFSLEVENPVAALARLVDWLGESRLEERAAERICLELKDLQLCRYQGLDITPPTCGRASGERLRSCGRRAA